jgi:hypothetical protein
VSTGTALVVIASVDVCLFCLTIGLGCLGVHRERDKDREAELETLRAVHQIDLVRQAGLRRLWEVARESAQSGGTANREVTDG